VLEDVQSEMELRRQKESRLKNTVNMERFYWPLSIYASKIIGTTIQAKQILQRIGQNRLKILQGLLQ
tara:strand:- start:506 stop:706 length:201 start_codon:yes stop_codon:yes gene_type:complete